HVRIPRADLFPDSMEVDHVLAVRVIRRQVGPAAEPFLVALGEVAEVGVHRGYHGTARMQHQRDAGGRETPPRTRNLSGEFLTHLAEHIGEVDARLLEDTALDQDTRPAAAATVALPKVFAEPAGAVQLLQGGADAVLQIPKVSGGRSAEVGWRHV